ncbi:MAG: tetratricopeptide repeat protein [Pyrinomonadaceae bacterium]
MNNTLAGFEKSLEQGKFEEIERPLLDYAIAHPNDAKALSLLAELRHRQFRLQEAKGLYQRVLTFDPNSAAAKINLGRITFELGQKDEARQILNGINQTSLVSPLEQLNLARALFLVGEFQKALNSTENLSIKLRNNEALPIIAASNLELGNRQKFDELIPLIKKASADNQILAAQLAEILQNAGMKHEAVDLLRSALATGTNNVRILVLLGRAEVLTQEIAQARQHLNRAATIEPNSAEILSAQALLENAQGNSAAALALLKKARQYAPNSTTVISDYILTAIRVNQAQNAVDAAKKLLELKPNEPESQYLFGAASLQNGNITSAQQALERFVMERPQDSRGCLALGLTLATQRDRLEAARNQLAHCLEIDPNNFEAKYQLGLSYKTQGETTKAVELLEEVTRLAPNYAAALRDLGALYLQTGAEKQARDALERAVALNSQDADTHFQLSRLYNLTGEMVLAKQHFEMFQKLKNSGAKSVQ